MENDLEDIEDMEDDGETSPKVSNNGKRPMLDQNSVTGAFSTPGDTSIPKTLLIPGNDVCKLVMRADIPSKRMAFLLSRVYSKCQSHNYKTGSEWFILFVASLCGISAKRAELVVSAIIGELKHKERAGGGGIMDKIKGFVGGDKSDVE